MEKNIMPRSTYILKGGEGLDDNGQPLNRKFNAARLADRTVDELLGICKGLICDGVISEDEARFLVQWVDKQRAEISVWPINVLAERIASIMQDHEIDEQERRDLFGLLSEISAGGSPQDVVRNLSTTLPLTKPVPDVIFEKRSFSFTGKFFFGTRNVCQNAVMKRGGSIHDNPINGTDYLVIGTLGSTDWIHSAHGRKIEKAVELSTKGVPLALICEEHWSRYL
jgi:NAD-dependent DNA ligase